jgi:hypothetical protein
MAVAINKCGCYLNNRLSFISLPQLLLRLGRMAFSVGEIIHKFNENKGFGFVGLPAAPYRRNRRYRLAAPIDG